MVFFVVWLFFGVVCKSAKAEARFGSGISSDIQINIFYPFSCSARTGFIFFSFLTARKNI